MRVHGKYRNGGQCESRPDFSLSSRNHGKEIGEGHDHSPLAGDLEAGKTSIGHHREAGDGCSQLPHIGLKGEPVGHGEKSSQKGIGEPPHKSYVESRDSKNVPQPSHVKRLPQFRAYLLSLS